MGGGLVMFLLFPWEDELWSVAFQKSSRFAGRLYFLFK